MKRFALIILCLVFCTHCTEGRPPTRTDSTGSTDSVRMGTQTETSVAPGASNTTSAQKAYVDPDTGELIPRPAQDASAEGNAIRPAALGSADEKVEIKPSPVEGGGIMVDVKGRFQNPIKASVDGQGGSKIDHAVDD